MGNKQVTLAEFLRRSFEIHGEWYYFDADHGVVTASRTDEYPPIKGGDFLVALTVASEQIERLELAIEDMGEFMESWCEGRVFAPPSRLPASLRDASVGQPAAPITTSAHEKKYAPTTIETAMLFALLTSMHKVSPDTRHELGGYVGVIKLMFAQAEEFNYYVNTEAFGDPDYWERFDWVREASEWWAAKVAPLMGLTT